jgi:hypothetical protein
MTQWLAANGSRSAGEPLTLSQSKIDAQSRQGDAPILQTRSERNGVCCLEQRRTADSVLTAYRNEENSRNKRPETPPERKGTGSELEMAA